MEQLNDTDLQDCLDTFNFLDVNKNNKIELSELCNGLSQLGINLSIREIKALLDHVGKKSHESLSFEEYKSFYVQCLQSHKMTREEALQLFLRTDVNKDGFIDVVELKYMLIDKGELLNNDEIHDLLRDYDHNRDLRLNTQEFLDAVYSWF